ncbi:hypothetical protein MNEG_11187 [Monoraphidium neglectum]|uniref:Uncharacterized protein n=1 Tax=Monoraphidium neglectum TaxID=145388 RepID=A0A0D2JAK7_9CHLO|nr:hypothetical protein MNEG_11187 [Monoraphidium neglectum]KIY96772.1 hypothetical protein MNEG_11187 [Monoraphidium neglectum]|eukprot:XP_013895792.1 hypothetical protein MNEG_11187 [Monoraphidium neglectum]
MAATAASGTRKAVGAVAAALGLGYGAYYASQAGVVRSLEKEREDLETKVFVFQGKSRRAESDSQETEALIAALRQQSDLDAAAASEISAQLDDLRSQVQQLEAQQQQRAESAARSKQEAAEAAARLERLRQDAQRFKADAAEADRALGAAAAAVAEARRRVANPLRHPALQRWRGGGQ